MLFFFFFLEERPCAPVLSPDAPTPTKRSVRYRAGPRVDGRCIDQIDATGLPIDNTMGRGWFIDLATGYLSRNSCSHQRRCRREAPVTAPAFNRQRTRSRCCQVQT